MHAPHLKHDTPGEIISAASQRRTASMFNIGNLIVIMLAGVPLMLASSTSGKGMILYTAMAIIPIIFWFGASMLLYALNKHHPSEKVGHYTQWAAYRFYAVTGALIVIGTFFPSDIRYYQAFWAVAALILIPWSIRDLLKIKREDWQPMQVPGRSEEEHY